MSLHNHLLSAQSCSPSLSIFKLPISFSCRSLHQPNIQRHNCEHKCCIMYVEMQLPVAPSKKNPVLLVTASKTVEKSNAEDSISDYTNCNENNIDPNKVIPNKVCIKCCPKYPIESFPQVQYTHDRCICMVCGASSDQLLKVHQLFPLDGSKFHQIVLQMV